MSKKRERCGRLGEIGLITICGLDAAWMLHAYYEENEL